MLCDVITGTPEEGRNRRNASLLTNVSFEANDSCITLFAEETYMFERGIAVVKKNISAAKFLSR